MSGGNKEHLVNSAIAQICFKDYLSLSELINSLEKLATVYSVLGMADALLMERTTSRILDDELNDWQYQVDQVVANKIVWFVTNRISETRYLIARSEYALTVITCQPSESWIIDLIGKLNPIRCLVDLLILFRDWNADKNKKEIENSKILQEAINLELANRIQKLEIIEKSIELLKKVGTDEEQIAIVVNKMLGEITGNVGECIATIKSADIIIPQSYEEIFQPIDLTELTRKTPEKKFWNVCNEFQNAVETISKNSLSHEKISADTLTSEFYSKDVSYKQINDLMSKLPKLFVEFGRFNLNGFQIIRYLSIYITGVKDAREAIWELEAFYKQITGEELATWEAKKIINFFDMLSLVEFEFRELPEGWLPHEEKFIIAKPILRKIILLIAEMEIEQIG